LPTMSATNTPTASTSNTNTIDTVMDTEDNLNIDSTQRRIIKRRKNKHTTKGTTDNPSIAHLLQQKIGESSLPPPKKQMTSETTQQSQYGKGTDSSQITGQPQIDNNHAPLNNNTNRLISKVP